MKRITALTLLTALVMTAAGAGGGDTAKGKGELDWMAFMPGMAAAKKSDKKLLVDVYTDWCGWCKRLDRDVYQNDKVSGYLKDHYVLVKLNAESSDTLRFKDKKYTQIEFAQSFGITGYPSTIFFDAKGEPVNLVPGYLPAEKYLPIFQFIAEDYYKKMSWQDYQKVRDSLQASAKKTN